MKKDLTINFHLIKKCNYHCNYCYAQFKDSNKMTYTEAVSIINEISDSGFSKINFAGGEPFLFNGLGNLIKLSKERGLITSIISNGSLLNKSWLEQFGEYLDIFGISCDSANEYTHKAIGRGTGTSVKKIINSYDMINQYNEKHEDKIFTKMNTVVNRINFNEDMSSLVLNSKVLRWKLLQVLPIQNENDQIVDSITINNQEFYSFVNRHSNLKNMGVEVVPENNDAMTESYLMIDPDGRFYQNTNGKYFKSKSILKIGIQKAINEINFNKNKFLERGGLYHPSVGNEIGAYL